MYINICICRQANSIFMYKSSPIRLGLISIRSLSRVGKIDLRTSIDRSISRAIRMTEPNGEKRLTRDEIMRLT